MTHLRKRAAHVRGGKRRGRDDMADDQITDVNEAWADLRTFLRQAEAAGELETIEGADPNLEIGAIYGNERVKISIRYFPNPVTIL